MRKVLLLALLATAAPAQDRGTLENPALDEVSGLARSLADPTILWAHNDSGNDAVLYRVGLKGEDLGEVRLRGGSLTDWEDIASFRWQGQPALLLADVGDNFAARSHATLYAVRDPGQGVEAELLWVLNFRYPDGARDCEAVAVDSATGEILLLTKRDRPPRVYRLPLPRQQPKGMQTAELLGEVKTVLSTPMPDRRLKGRWESSWLHRPSALALADDGRRAVIVTPQNAYIYRREHKQDWLDALNGQPRVIRLPDFPQIEAGALSANGRYLYVASEQSPMGFATITLP